jgi:hypothetical protein
MVSRRLIVQFVILLACPFAGLHCSIRKAEAESWLAAPYYSTPDNAHVQEELVIKDANNEQRVFYNQSKAVLVIEANYDDTSAWTPVPGPAVRNAEKIRESLERRGFHVDIWKDLNSDLLRSELAQIFGRYGYLPNGRLFFYYFGHGYRLSSLDPELPDRTFLVPVDAPDPAKDRPGFLSKALNISQLAEFAREADTKHVFFALEACQAGALIALLGGPTPEDPKGYIFSKEIQHKARQVITAGSAGKDIPAEGVFTDTLLEGLTNAGGNSDGYVTGRELMEYVVQTVPKRAEGQHPESGTFQQYDGDFVFGVAQSGSIENAAGTAGGPQYAICRHPDNGFERWGNSVQWSADSGWRGGGSDPHSFCGSKKLERETTYPGRLVTLTKTSEDHRSVYNPFKHDEYRYTCQFTDEWDPVYKEARSPSCGKL